MHVDILVAEIGSTTTMVNAFNGVLETADSNTVTHESKNRLSVLDSQGQSRDHDNGRGHDHSRGHDRSQGRSRGGHDTTRECPRYIGQGVAPTSVDQGDVRIGLDAAVEDLARKQGEGSEFTWDHFYATSSAAGGLRMTVHGLVYDMTVRAGKEAALGAGANLHMVTAGKLRDSDLEKLRSIHPNIILIAGGVDYGERDTALYNSERIAELLKAEGLHIPVIYAGNIENRDEVVSIFSHSGGRLYTTENVYPRIDQLNIEPTRAIIQQVFEEHITGGPGMQYIRERIDGPVVPTPGAVMQAAMVLKQDIGDLLVVDVGGATTDVHSVTAGSEEITRILIAPEPEAKRTVEGDLGTYVSRRNVLKGRDLEQSLERLGLKQEEFEEALESLSPIPSIETEVQLAEELARSAALQALMRHAGSYRDLYGPEGKKQIAEGKDLSAVKYIIGTGGALARLPGREKIMERAIGGLPGNSLVPPQNAKISFDSHYIMASLGVLATQHPEAAVALMKESIWPDRR